MAEIRIDATQVPMSLQPEEEKGRVEAYIDFLICAPVGDRERGGKRFSSWEGRLR